MTQQRLRCVVCGAFLSRCLYAEVPASAHLDGYRLPPYLLCGYCLTEYPTEETGHHLYWYRGAALAQAEVQP